jgi:flagellar FliL protein
MAKKDEHELAEKPAAAARSGKKVLLLVGGAVLLLLIGAGAGAFLSGLLPVGAKEAHAKSAKAAKTEEPAPPERAIYVALDPPFTVNLQGTQTKPKFLQVTLQALVREAQAEQALKDHLPVIRNDLVMIFSSKTPQELATREGKEALQAEALAAIQRVLKKAGSGHGVEAVLFTTFVMQ